jgi:hypothetical protein
MTREWKIEICAWVVVAAMIAGACVAIWYLHLGAP